MWVQPQLFCCKHGLSDHLQEYCLWKTGWEGINEGKSRKEAAYLQGRNRDEDIENGPVDTVGEGEDVAPGAQLSALWWPRGVGQEVL